MDCPFQVGDEVVCVDDEGQRPERPLRRGMVYTISGFAHGGYCVLLAEVMNVGRGWHGHRAHRFRKVERKTDKLSLTQWLSQPSGDTDRIDRSAPIAPRKRERAQ